MSMVRDRGPSRTPRSFSSVFNSSVAQRPSTVTTARAFGGRPIGPSTYHPPPPGWHNDPQRQNAAFSSKTALRTYATPLTAHIDFQITSINTCIGAAPGARGLHWPEPPEVREPYREPGLDAFSDAVGKSLWSDVMGSSRTYASSFMSTVKRGEEQVGVSRPTSPGLGPGVYDVALASVRVRDPKRMNYTFKSQSSGSVFGAPANQPPDTVQSIQSAILKKDWTSKGVAFSTRERFPRIRPRWKD